MNAYSKWMEVILKCRTTTEATIQAPRDLFARCGIPEILVSDNGPQFKSVEFKEFLVRMRVKHLKSAPYHPKSNGAVEKCVQTFKSAMRAMSKQPGKVNEKLSTFLFQYRNTPHSTTGAPPTELFLRRRVRSRFSMLQPTSASNIKKQLRQQEQAPQSKKDFDVGEKVWLRDYRGTDKWVDGVVIEKPGVVNYHIQSKERVVHRHADQLKRDDRPTTTGPDISVDRSEKDQPSPIESEDREDPTRQAEVTPPMTRRNPARNRRPPERFDL